VGVRVGVAYLLNKLALRTKLRNQNHKSQFCIFDSFRDISVQINDFLKFVGVKVGVGRSIDRYSREKYKSVLILNSSIKTVGATVLGGDGAGPSFVQVFSKEIRQRVEFPCFVFLFLAWLKLSLSSLLGRSRL